MTAPRLNDAPPADPRGASALSPGEAWRRLAEEPESLLLDLRSLPEWQFVGVPDLRALSKAPLFLSWQDYPEMTVRRDYVAALEAAGIARERPLVLLCRAGDRAPTVARALAASGFHDLAVVADGFEGPPDPEGRRGRLAGWKAEGLPWAQQ